MTLFFFLKTVCRWCCCCCWLRLIPPFGSGSHSGWCAAATAKGVFYTLFAAKFYVCLFVCVSPEVIFTSFILQLPRATKLRRSTILNCCILCRMHQYARNLMNVDRTLPFTLLTDATQLREGKTILNFQMWRESTSAWFFRVCFFFHYVQRKRMGLFWSLNEIAVTIENYIECYVQPLLNGMLR